jgi:hypothetical protein
MKLYFDHILGKQKDKDFVFSLVSATFKDEEWDWAFENGWAPLTKWFDSTFTTSIPLIWYQSRQSRIVLDDYSPNPKTKKLLNKTPVKYIIDTKLHTSIDSIFSIYSDYCSYKNFGDLISKQDITYYFNPHPNSTHYYIHFYYEDTLLAITKLSLWSKSLLSEIFWWNYKNPDLSIGKLSYYLEIQLAKQLGLNYLYTGISYNEDSIYKSHKKGFQFWTGRDWLSDTNCFINLCKYDDSIETIEELHDYQYTYLNNLRI